MDTNTLKKFAQNARNLLIDQVTARLDMVLAEAQRLAANTPRRLQSWKLRPRATAPR